MSDGSCDVIGHSLAYAMYGVVVAMRRVVLIRCICSAMNSSEQYDVVRLCYACNVQ